MSVAALRVELERELVVWGLSFPGVPENWQRTNFCRRFIAEHLPIGTRLRVPAMLMPDWYMRLWWDRTQLDGRAEVIESANGLISVVGAQPGRIELDTRYSIELDRFVDAVLSGAVGDSS
jgi:hypothetical protein